MSSAGGVPARKDRILVVDDEAPIARCLQRFLSRSGFDVAIALGTAEALAMFDGFAPDLVISDFRMPGMNGAELLAEVKRRSPSTSLVIASGYVDLDAVRDEVDLDEICFLRKPWDNGDLLAQLRGLIQRGRR
jgi:DNA-binding NtrC family response regulator